jgi:DNA-binding transcriptional regulator LsrR (DeoR family)
MPKTPAANPKTVARVAALLRDYGGLPLTRNDVQEELHIAEQQARACLKKLVETGQVRMWPNPEYSATLFYAWVEPLPPAPYEHNSRYVPTNR